ncbi:DNA polymerase III subunit delta' [Leptolyngbya sp. NIES-2104]|uniref:DNA polymerase III subunit delta' n=1 Tax=Leptolyngbya sp. NIES-2104 TaxID=1552121 RepID=UPI0006EC6C18|nr:DNA polymerase III subunit delta' [Leptolyngbya sp. NIES-2104]GAP94483.1 DNA polymerase III delta prime subunit [Leptolyngbya sp. NIES-2104]
MSVFSSLIGQPQAVELLDRAIAVDRLAPAYLFVGTAGIGKGLAAECFLEALLSSSRSRILNRNHPDLLWVEPTYLHQGKRLTAIEAEAAGVKRKTPPMIRLEQIREVSQFLSRPPLEAARSAIVIEQAETMPESAANALLKTLEEPGRATIILLATSVESVLPTIVSRCQRIPFARLDVESMAQVLKKVGHPEILSKPQLLSLAQGSPGAAIAHQQTLESIPLEVLESVMQPPKSLRQALTTARTIAKTIDGETQLWLIDYLQQVYWTQSQNARSLRLLEKAKEQLLAYVQSQLVWEVMWMEFCAQPH